MDNHELNQYTKSTDPLEPKTVATAVDEEANQSYVTGLKLFSILASVTMAAFLMLLDGSIIGVAISKITSEFHSLDDIGWYMAAYQLASAALQPLSGKIYTHISTKWPYLFFFALFKVGSLICGAAQSSAMLIGGRAIACMGSSGLLNGGMTIIAGAVPLQKRPVYTGVYLGISQLGIVSGPLIGGALTEFTTCRWCTCDVFGFYINLPVGALVAVGLVFLEVPELVPKARLSLGLFRKTIPELDLVGFSLFSTNSVMLLLVLQLGGGGFAWNSPTVINLFWAAGVAAVLFFTWAYKKQDRAMIPPSIASHRIVWTSAINGSMLVASILVAAQYLPIYFQGVRGYGPAMSGVNTLPEILSQLLTVILSGALVPKIGYYLPFAAAGSAISALRKGLVSTFAPNTPTHRWVGYQIILGSGRGIGMLMGLIAIQNVLSAEKTPVGIAFMIFCQNFAGAVFVVVAEVIFRQQMTRNISRYAPDVSVDAAINAGASASSVRGLAPAGSRTLGGLLLAYANCVNKVFLLLVGLCGVGFVAAFGMGWVDTGSKTVPEKKKTGDKIAAM
ncbi:efflux pump [Bimuria novae-zelandiae CBS 107.79]|uniref:Efflux pump n=1 Tax=Bimuria novae-zelandiae CBS 107.79 TaxID=1447943 RepID=A0A6A5VP21_9PLEO|nr:efflux pump [Bimuria novae-zelandiae CBS 107.79]